ncbi:gluconate 2-dehydrogenase subunit 3 family protein [Haloglomus halophilum]|uniref:gluconate 2-dehydrogenase subunit 3 family protein n=1 Tax=Haloglomus halophilum TaxID=2962672 RepID=UPI0020C99886|nr:gluconate 2-dehydrogenase subunit 3 family protein [Haloglomus halophilum]
MTGDDRDADASLTRRDAMAALTAAGAATALGGTLSWAVLNEAGDDDATTEGFTERDRETLVALAEHLYPSTVTGIPEFVERYTVGRVRDRPEYATGMREALAALDEYAVQWTDERFVDLDTDRRGTLLNSMGVTRATPEPDGLDPERVRFYLVNELLFALYSSPTGGKLVGIENPQGHPGGTTSYRQPPDADR